MVQNFDKLATHGKIFYPLSAPIAQWIERCPPEAKTRVRIAVGVPNKICPEQPKVPVEQFLNMLRFEGRNKLTELPSDWDEVNRDDFV